MIDVIGTISTVRMIDWQTSEVTPLDGFHVNVTADEMREDLEPYRVTPSAMRRVFAGDDPLNPVMTVALKFDNEDAAISTLSDLWPREVSSEP